MCSLATGNLRPLDSIVPSNPLANVVGPRSTSAARFCGGGGVPIASLGPSVASWKSLEFRETMKSKLPCVHECESAWTFSHSNFQLPSRSFAGSERVLPAGVMNCESGDVECKSASCNPQFGADRVLKRSQEQGSRKDLGFSLHDLMDQAGIATTHARTARLGFSDEVAKLRNGSANAENPELSMADVARAALEISAEDDALVSHSSVPLPVDCYLERLDSMAAEFSSHYLPVHSADVFGALENYLWFYKGFRCTKVRASRDARDFYLNGVLTRRQGPPVMLGLIFSEMVTRLWRSGYIDFLVDMNVPVDGVSFPVPVYKKPNTLSGSSVDNRGTSTSESWKVTHGLSSQIQATHHNLLTPERVLLEVLKSLKKLYWPWRALPGAGKGSDFLEAATAANRGFAPSASNTHGPFESLFNAPSSERGSEVARARAAQYRLQRGVWTSTTFGDLRRALAASERLVMLGGDAEEHRDYGMLLFHAGLYNQAFLYLSHYASKVSTSIPAVFNALEAQEAAAVQLLLDRLRLILSERSWADDEDSLTPIVPPPDPW